MNEELGMVFDYFFSCLSPVRRESRAGRGGSISDVVPLNWRRSLDGSVIYLLIDALFLFWEEDFEARLDDVGTFDAYIRDFAWKKYSDTSCDAHNLHNVTRLHKWKGENKSVILFFCYLLCSSRVSWLMSVKLGGRHCKQRTVSLRLTVRCLRLRLKYKLALIQGQTRMASVVIQTSSGSQPIVHHWLRVVGRLRNHWPTYYRTGVLQDLIPIKNCVVNDRLSGLRRFAVTQLMCCRIRSLKDVWQWDVTGRVHIFEQRPAFTFSRVPHVLTKISITNETHRCRIVYSQ